MKSYFLIAFMAFGTLFANGQKTRKILGESSPERGWISGGLRNTFSFFNHGASSPGYGVGGHFRMQVHERVNTEWFADYLTDSEGDKANRKDCHIGWSVMFYLMKPKNFSTRFLPYVVAGHCFDYSRIALNSTPGVNRERWSAAVQAGFGTHINLNPRFDISISAQYMLHLGKELHVHYVNHEPEFELESHAAPEGHLLVQVSANYKLFKLFK